MYNVILKISLVLEIICFLSSFFIKFLKLKILKESIVEHVVKIKTPNFCAKLF